MSTRAIQWLKQKRVPFEIVKYEHRHKGAEFAAQAVGFPLAQTIKTLVTSLADHRYVLALMPGDRQLSMKKLAGALGVKKAELADTATAERLTGYLVGGISPFGTRTSMPAIVEAGLQEYSEVMINAGQRGCMLKMVPSDIIQTLSARVADLAV